MQGGKDDYIANGNQSLGAVKYQTPLPAGGVQMGAFLPWTLARRSLQKQVITPLGTPQEFLDDACRERQVREMEQDTLLMRALGLAHHWQRLLDEGRFSSMSEIATAEGIDLGKVSKMSRLAQREALVAGLSVAKERCLFDRQFPRQPRIVR